MLLWTDNQSVLYAINKAKAHPSNRVVLLELLTLAASYDITLKAVFIPTKLNTTADLLTRHVFAALSSDYAIERTLFVSLGGYRCNTVAFADPRGRTAHYLLGGKASNKPYTYFSSVRSAFLHADELQGRAVWFNPPFALLEQSLELLRTVYNSAPYRTYLLGIIPFVPHRPWYHRLVGEGRFFRVKRMLHRGTLAHVATRAPTFTSVRFNMLPYVHTT